MSGSVNHFQRLSANARSLWGLTALTLCDRRTTPALFNVAPGPRPAQTRLATASAPAHPVRCRITAVTKATADYNYGLAK